MDRRRDRWTHTYHLRESQAGKQTVSYLDTTSAAHIFLPSSPSPSPSPSPPPHRPPQLNGTSTVVLKAGDGCRVWRDVLRGTPLQVLSVPGPQQRRAALPGKRWRHELASTHQGGVRRIYMYLLSLFDLYTSFQNGAHLLPACVWVFGRSCRASSRGAS